MRRHTQASRKSREIFNLTAPVGRVRCLLAGVLFATWGYVHRDDAPWYFDATAGALNFVVPALFLVGFISTL